MQRTPAQIYKVVCDILCEQLGVDKADISPQAYILSNQVPDLQQGEHPDLGADSLDLIEFCMAVESEFDINIQDDEAAQLHTVQDWLTHIEGASNH